MMAYTTEQCMNLVKTFYCLASITQVLCKFKVKYERRKIQRNSAINGVSVK
jgi:hypothetical protein